MVAPVPPLVVSGQPIASARGNQVVGRLNAHKTHVSTLATWPGSNVSSLAPGLVSVRPSTPGMYMVSWDCDINPAAGGFGYMDLYPSNYSTAGAVGWGIVISRYFETPGLPRVTMSGMAMVDYQGLDDIWIRGNCYASSCRQNGGTLRAWQLYAY